MDSKVNRREFLKSLTAGSLTVFGAAFLPGCNVESIFEKKPAAQKPNFIFILTDDQGYTDVGVYGAEGFKTPNLDRMAAEGMIFTDFHTGGPICSPTRASFITACYPQRVGMEYALAPIEGRIGGLEGNIGISSDELTIAESLKQNGYATACFGKWHLGHQKKFLPVHHGFDEYFGIPTSNGLTSSLPGNEAVGLPDKLPVVEDDEIIGYDPDISQLTTIYTERSIKFIEKNKNRPFFLYLAHAMPHVPIAVSDKFKGKSQQGLYGDVIMELDWSVGKIFKTLKDNDIDKNTIVMFTSDNGPWLAYGNHAGSAWLLREGKVTTFEGGMRVPFIVRWPKKIPKGGVCKELVTIMDVFPTVAYLTGSKLPEKKIDGKNIWPLLAGDKDAKSPHEAFYYYFLSELQAVRSGKWKLHFPHYYYHVPQPGMDGVRGETAPANIELALFDLENDIEEKVNVADKYPEIVEKLSKLADQMRDDLGDSLMGKNGNGRREPGKL
jgi:arylsulfatase A